MLKAGKAGGQLDAQEVEAGEGAMAEGVKLSGHPRRCRRQHREAAQRGQRAGGDGGQRSTQVVIIWGELEDKALQRSIAGGVLQGEAGNEERRRRSRCALS